MKLLTFEHNGTTSLGFLSPAKDGVYPLTEYPDCNALLLDENRDMEALYRAALQRPMLPGRDVRLKAPLPHPRQDVICLGLNYREHADEIGVRAPEDAVYFSKRVNRAADPDTALNGHFDIVDDLDYEVELAVILGRDCYKATPATALDYVFGYTILNDLSARTIQKRHKQWYLGKSLDGFTVMGPWIVTRDEFGDDLDKKICLWVNKELRQKSRTGFMIHSIPQIIAELSAGMTLQAGTIIATGTPSGVVLGQPNGKYLQSGDAVLCFIEGIGYLSNTIG